MAKIKVLAQEVAELIAAGEVVERPASIVKELVENAIDADATQITIEIKGGGIGYIRITDNGQGMDAEDVPTAFLRHATSKVRSVNDLEVIGTLGFRGEALASIAAVSKVEITTKTPDSTDGTSYSIQGEIFDGPRPAGAPTGTTLIIRDVFYNIPARMKFLRRDVTEGNAIAQVIDKCALSHPEIAFTFIRDTSTKLRTSGNGDLRATTAAVYGRDFAQNMIAVDYTLDNSIRVTGLIGMPSAAKASRAYQNFFINERYVHTRTCGVALEQAYKGKLMTGRFPSCVLNVQVEPSQVDPNVHPAKIEVRFVQEKPIFHAVYYATKSGLSTLDSPLAAIPTSPRINPLALELSSEKPVQQRLDQPQPESATSSSNTIHDRIELSSGTRTFNKQQTQTQNDVTPTDFGRFSPDYLVTINQGENKTGSNDSAGTLAFDKPENSSQQIPINLRQIGELFDTYILLEQGQELLLVDKHAAHERILYEEIRANAENQTNRQVLLSPIPVTLQRNEYSVLLEHLETVNNMGFLVEDFGTGTLIVRETPVALDGEDVSFLLSEAADKLLKQQTDLTPHVLERLYDSIACKTALRAGDKNNSYELAEIINLLVSNPHITHCPHGRPIVLRIPQRDIEKMFGRLGA